MIHSSSWGNLANYGKHPQVKKWLAWNISVVYNSPWLLANRDRRRNRALKAKMSNRWSPAPCGNGSPEWWSCQQQTAPKCPNLNDPMSPRAKLIQKRHSFQEAESTRNEKYLPSCPAHKRKLLYRVADV